MPVISITDDSGLLLASPPDNANSYVTEVFAEDWLAQLGTSTFTPESSYDLSALLIRASEYVDRRFGPLFVGRPISGTQPLAWPRSGAQDSHGNSIPQDTIPLDILRAVTEYAVQIDKNGGELLPPDRSQYDSFGTLRYEENSVQIGSLRQSRKVHYDTYHTSDSTEIELNQTLLWTKYPSIDQMVLQYTTASTGSTGVVYDPGTTRLYLSDEALGLTDGLEDD